MNKQEIIYGIITAHNKPTINQDDLTDAYIEFTGENITNREIRQIIADCIEDETYLIISTPHRPGGYFPPCSRYEGITCADRLESQGIKLITKARKIRKMTDAMFPGREVQQELPGVVGKVG